MPGIAWEFANSGRVSEQSLDQVLTGLREAGQHDSSGHFHIDFTSRARKMAEHQAWEPALYLLKAVQAAVALKSEWITIKLKRDQVKIEIGKPVAPFDIEALESGSAGARHLGDVLRAAVAAGATEVSLGAQERSWSWNEGAIDKRPSPFAPGVTITVAHAEKSLLARLLPCRRLAHIQQVLAARCVLCPIPVRLDGRLLNLPFPEQAAWLQGGSIPSTDWDGRTDFKWMGEHHWLTAGPDCFCLASPACRVPYQARVTPIVANHWDGGVTSCTSVLSWFDGEVEGCYADNPRPPGPTEVPIQIKYEDGGGDVGAVATNSRVLSGIDGCLQRSLLDTPGRDENAYPATRLSSWLGLPMVARMASRLFYVQDGILLNSVAVQSSLPGTTAVLARADVKVDLSQLTVVGTAEVEADVAWVLAQEQLIGEACRDSLRERSFGLPQAELRKWQSLFKRLKREEIT